ncbi:SurA N-terminal domain-containing protein [Bartonella apihabitans]|uniref:peptidyl-prolyl cis-trans isomerase n=1 Tax=uncultured Bartonella sp. TaxID=104108 RepID=UPI0025EC0B7F|nr:peptidyl-prolyl cis-trans isomerase [Bartonella apihabitans]WLT09266.1 SurA N-terminal domain-containing protein [Bartonella apihabitans]
MLDTIRSAVNSWIAKVFLGLLVLCFVLLWGVPELRRTSGHDLFTSGKSTIKANTYRLALQDQIKLFSGTNQLPRLLSEAEAKQYGLPQMALSQLQQDVLLDEQVRLMKIGVSKDGIARAIGADRFFQQQGQFDRNIFLSYLKQEGLPEADFIDYLAGKEKRNQLIYSAVNDMAAPDVFYSALLNYRNETRSVDYLLVTKKEIGEIKDPTSEQLQKSFDAHKAEFHAPEYRQVTLMEMTPESLLKPADISEDEIKDYYTRNASRFMSPEERTVQILRFKTREQADNAAAKLRDGGTFEELVSAEHKTLEDITKGPAAKTGFSSTIARDIFELDLNKVSDVINDLEGPVIMRVVKITPQGPTPLEKAEPDIRNRLAKENAANAMRDNHDAIENARFEGASLDELAKQYKLDLRKITIDSKAQTPDGKAVGELPQQSMLVDNIFQATEGADLDPIAIKGGGYLWYRVDKIVDARDQTLDEVKDKVVALWKAEETQRLLDEKASKLEQELKDHKTLDDLARELGVTKKTARGLKRGGSDEVLGADGVNAAFSGPKGQSGVSKAADKDQRIVYLVTESVLPLNTDPKSLEPQLKTNIDAMVGADLGLEILDIANAKAPVKANIANLKAITNNLQ